MWLLINTLAMTSQWLQEIRMQKWVEKQSTLQQLDAIALHKLTNDNRQRLTNFAASSDLVIGATLFLHKDIHKLTWISPDGFTINQTHHFFISSRSRSNLLDVRSRRANIDSDHYIVVARRRDCMFMIKIQRAPRWKKYNISKLKEEDNCLRFTALVGNKNQRYD